MSAPLSRRGRLRLPGAGELGVHGGGGGGGGGGAPVATRLSATPRLASPCRFETMVGKQRQALLVWQQNNPIQHAEYAAQHLLQRPHWHVRELQRALEGVAAADVLQLSRGLRGQVGGRGLLRRRARGGVTA